MHAIVSITVFEADTPLGLIPLVDRAARYSGSQAAKPRCVSLAFSKYE